MAGYLQDPRTGGTLYVADNGDIFAPMESGGLFGLGAINWGKIGNFFKDTVAPVLLPAVAAKIAGSGGQQSGGSSGPPVVAVQTPFGGAGLGIDPSLLLLGGGLLLVMMMRK